MAGTTGGIVEFVRPGQHATFTAGGAISGGNLVRIAGTSRTVIATSAALQAGCVGVALFDGASGITNLSVATIGVYPLVAQGAITAGDDLTSGSVAGTVASLAAAAGATAADINNARNIVGRAYEGIANTATGRVKLML